MNDKLVELKASAEQQVAMLREALMCVERVRYSGWYSPEALDTDDVVDKALTATDADVKEWLIEHDRRAMCSLLKHIKELLYSLDEDRGICSSETLPALEDWIICWDGEP